MSIVTTADHIKHLPPINKEWWSEHVKYIKFRRQGIDIIGAKFEQESGSARANVIVSTGWSETFLKYSEMIKMLFERGFNVYTYDHQSQGLSGRWLPEPQSTWINSFDDYVDDFTFFVTSVPKLNNLPLFLVAASMGGLISGIAMSRLPNLVSRAVFLSPMFRNKCAIKYFHYQCPIPQPLAYWLAKINCYFGAGRMHCMGYFVENPTDKMPINVTSSSQEQLNIWNNIREEFPSVLSTCVTNDWLYHSLRAQKKFESRHQFIHSNTLIICAEHDYFVYNRAISLFAQRVPTCKVFYAPTSYHEVWAENDFIRGATLKAISDFFTQQSDDVSIVEPSTPLVLYDHTVPTYSVAEATFRSTGILIATLGVIIGITMILGENRKKIV